MKQVLIIILLLLLIPALSPAQHYDRGIFGTDAAPAELDTCAVQADSLSSRTVEWSGWSGDHFKGVLTLYGQAKILSGGPITFTPHFWPLYPDGTPGAMQTLDTFTVTDSVYLEYKVSAETWWGGCAGYKLTLVPGATTAATAIKLRELAK